MTAQKSSSIEEIEEERRRDVGAAAAGNQAGAASGLQTHPRRSRGEVGRLEQPRRKRQIAAESPQQVQGGRYSAHPATARARATVEGKTRTARAGGGDRRGRDRDQGINQLKRFSLGH